MMAGYVPRTAVWLCARHTLARAPNAPLNQRAVHERYKVKTVQPVVLRASRSRCACCTCSSG